MTAQPASNSSNGEADLLPAGEMLAINELSKILRCTRQQVIALCEDGSLEGAVDLRCRGSRAMLRVPRGAVVSFLESQKITASNGKRPAKHVRIAPTQTWRHYRPADALLQWLRAS